MIDKPQTIISVAAENVMRLKIVEIRPDGSLFVIGGKNEQGKTSLINAIVMALAGGKAVPEEPIRKGAKKAQVVIETEDLTITKKFTAKGATLEVRGKDGKRYTSPQKVLDALVGQLTFDPLEFSRMDPDKQARVLRELVGLNTAGIDANRAEAYAQRTEINRDLKRVEAALRELPHHKDAPAEEVSVGALADEHAKATERVATHGIKVGELVRLRDSRERVKQKIAGLERELESINKTGKKLKAEIDALEIPDLAAISTRLENAEDTNRKVRENQQRASVEERVKSLDQQSSALTDRISDLDERKTKLISEAEFPVEGLGFGEGGIVLDGLPFKQASSAQQLKVSVAIGLATNKMLKALWIKDGSLLDEDNLALIAEMAKEAGSTVFIERVGEGDECSVVLEEGEVKDGKA